MLSRREPATPANATDTAGLEQRLRAMQDAETWYDGGYRPVCLVNPDGPEAADALAALRAENERQNYALINERQEHARTKAELARLKGIAKGEA